MAITAFSNFSITISDGGTVPSLDYLSTKTFVDIGTGNVLKISWNTPTATDNAVNSYKVYILRYDSASGSYKALYDADIGDINEFYLKSALFNNISQSFIPLRIYVEAVSKYGAVYNGISNITAVNVSKGSGSYTKVEEGYAQPVMKRSLAFTKLDYKAITTSDGTVLTGEDGKAIYGKTSSVQDASTGWSLVQEFYSKDASDKWHISDMSFEALTDINGEIVTDINGDTVYVL